VPCCIGLVLVSTLLEGLGDPVFYLALQRFSVEFAIGRRRPLGRLAVSASTRLCVSTEQRAASLSPSARCQRTLRLVGCRPAVLSPQRRQVRAKGRSPS